MTDFLAGSITLFIFGVWGTFIIWRYNKCHKSIGDNIKNEG